VKTADLYNLFLIDFIDIFIAILLTYTMLKTCKQRMEHCNMHCKIAETWEISLQITDFTCVTVRDHADIIYIKR